MQDNCENPLISKRYKIERALGSGSFGTVYLCRDLKLANLAVALKLFHPATLNQTLVRARIHRELRACFRVQSDHTVFFYDTVRDHDRFGYTMEFVDGESLALLCRNQHRPKPLQTIEILRQIALGLSAIHKCGIVHRDLKPANILLSHSGIVKVTDYGLARPIASSCVLSTDCVSIAATHEINSAEETQSAVLVGSPAYICPDYIRTKQLTHSCDLYALGVIGFELLTAKRPFPEETIQKLLMHKLASPAPCVTSIDSSIPKPLGEIVSKLLQRKPQDRFSTCEDLIDALEQCKNLLNPSKQQPQGVQPKRSKSTKMNVRVRSSSLDPRWSVADAFEWLRMHFAPAGRGSVGSKTDTLSSNFHLSEMAVLGTMLAVALLGLGYLRSFLLDKMDDNAQPFRYETNGMRFFSPATSVVKPIVARSKQEESQKSVEAEVK